MRQYVHECLYLVCYRQVRFESGADAGPNKVVFHCAQPTDRIYKPQEANIRIL